MLFLIGSIPPTDFDSYLSPQPDGKEELCPDYIPALKNSEGLPRPNKAKLFYHVNRLTNVHPLYIPPSVAPHILAITHGEGHLGFSRCYEIITRSWFICGLTKPFRSFICHCSQCLALQTRQHLLYDLFPPIESPHIPFCTLTLDFVLTLALSKERYNAIMSVTWKFSKQVMLVEGADT